MKKICWFQAITALAISTEAATHLVSPQTTDRPAIGETVIVETFTDQCDPSYVFAIVWVDARGCIRPIFLESSNQTKRRLKEWQVPSEEKGVLVTLVFDTKTGEIVEADTREIHITAKPTNIFGDLNNDGAVNERDMVMLDTFTAFPNVNGFQAHWTVEQSRKADLNLDGKVDVADANIMASYLVGDLPGLPLGDVNGDGKVNTFDISLIRRHILGIRPLAHPEMGDVNQDGRVDEKDIVQIRSFILRKVWTPKS